MDRGKSKLYARDIHTFDLKDISLADDGFISEMRDRIKQGDGYVIKNAGPRGKLKRIREYLTQIGRNSLPNYQAIEQGCPNFHRMNRFDPRAYVKGCFHQFSFFPWNQDVFGLFELFKDIYHLKNKISGLAAEKYLSPEPDDGCIARLSFQVYPNGCGMLNSHADPVDRHQLTVPLMLLSRKGEDFQQGGGYIIGSDGNKIIVDDFGTWGDVFFFNAQVIHGVDTIDAGRETDWLSFEGRWILLFAVNKLASTIHISNSVDYGNTQAASF